MDLELSQRGKGKKTPLPNRPFLQWYRETIYRDKIREDRSLNYIPCLWFVSIR